MNQIMCLLRNTTLALILFHAPIFAFSFLGSNGKNRGTTTTKPVVTIDLARIPQDLPAIQACRATVDFARNERLRDSEVSFLRASALSTSLSTGDVDTPNGRETANPNVRCVVARQGRDILATADCRFGNGGNEILVNNIFVRPDQRGQGLGKKLMEGVNELVAGARTNGKTKLLLTVYAQNTPAVRLYQSCGYQPDGPAHAMVQSLSQLTGANLLIAMSKKM